MSKSQALTVGSDPDCDIQLNIQTFQANIFPSCQSDTNSLKSKISEVLGAPINGRRITEAVVSTNDVIQVGHTPVRVAQLARQY